MPKKRESLVDRFWEKFDRPKEGCWEWTGYFSSTGYGQLIQTHGMTGFSTIYKAHRLAWMLFNGPIPDGMCVS